MLGMVTTLMMHFPVGSFIDAIFFVLKGYRLDGPAKLKDTRLNLVVARSVTGHLAIDVLSGVIKALVWAVIYLWIVRHDD